MVSFNYNIYGPGRTRPMSKEESHWRNLGVHLGMQMRKPVFDPMHKLTIRERMQHEKRFRGKEMAKMAAMTPHSC